MTGVQTCALPILKSVPLSTVPPDQPSVAGARPRHVFSWDAPVTGSLPVVLRTPDLEIESVVVSLLSPSDEEHRLEHLVLFDVRRGATDRLSLFVPDGGSPQSNVVKTRDLREIREERVTRKDADGTDVTPVREPPAAVMSPAEAYLMTSLLTGVVNSGTAASARSLGVTGEVAGKTGTTNDERDAWFVGYSPGLLALVWVERSSRMPSAAESSFDPLPSRA